MLMVAPISQLPVNANMIKNVIDIEINVHDIVFLDDKRFKENLIMVLSYEHVVVVQTTPFYRSFVSSSR